MTIALALSAGLVALYFGAEWLVRGSASLAQRLGVSPLMVGLTVVAYGTSAPELLVTSVAALDGQGGLAVGNAVGSNIFNIGVILGVTALVCPVRVQFQLIKIDTPIMIGVAVLFVFFFRDRQIAGWEAGTFLLALLAYTLLAITIARRQVNQVVQQQFDEAVPKPAGAVWRDVISVVAGLALLVVGSKWFVTGAVDMARLLNVNEAVIGLTIVAAGTSLPELATSLLAAFRQQADIAIGNVIGSNIYNILAILGVSGLLAPPLAGEGVGALDIYVMLGLSAVLLPIAWTGFQLRRWEGGLLLAVYVGYLAWMWPK